MTSVNVEGYGQAFAGSAMSARFNKLTKKELAAKIAEWTKTSNKSHGVAFWRELPKETLVIVAADMFANDAEREADQKRDAEAAEMARESEDLATVVAERGPVAEALTSILAAAEQAAGDTLVPTDHAGTYEVVHDELAATVEAAKQADMQVLADALRGCTGAVSVTVNDGDQTAVSTAIVEDVPPTSAPEAAPITGQAAGYRLRCTVVEGWLRRDQPRKPGDVATYKVVTDVSKATVIKSLRQAQAKLFEVASLYDDREHQAELEAI